MADAKVIQISDAVVDELNGAGFTIGPLPAPAERGYLPVFDLKDLKTLHVTVVPFSLKEERLDRKRCDERYGIYVSVQKKLTKADSAEIDPLMLLVEEISELFRAKRLAAPADAIQVKTESVPIYSEDHLERLRQFTSVMVITFRFLG